MLDIEFVIHKDPNCDAIEVIEDRGRVVYKIGRKLFETPELLVSMLTGSARAVIDGGHWFQLWKGDVIAAAPGPRRFPTQRPPGEVA